MYQGEGAEGLGANKRAFISTARDLEDFFFLFVTMLSQISLWVRVFERFYHCQNDQAFLQAAHLKGGKKQRLTRLGGFSS